MTLRVIDVGNSRTRVADRTDAGLEERASFATRDGPEGGALDQYLTAPATGGERPRSIVIASTVPALDEAWDDAARASGVPLRWLTAAAASRLPLDIATIRPEQVGADRVANAMAALPLGVNVLVIDMGTAITFDCVSAAGELLGGVIAPGPAMLQAGLASAAPHLPAVSVRRPERVRGGTSEACLESGLYYTVAGAIDRIAHGLLSEWTPEAEVIATGGWAPAFREACDVIERVEPDWTLRGIAAAAEYL